MKKYFISILGILLTACLQNPTSIDDPIRQLDAQIAERTNQIYNDIGSRITNRFKTYLNPKNIHDSINSFISLYGIEPNAAAVRADNFFNNLNKYYDVDNVKVLPLFGSRSNFLLSIKIDELTLLDAILLNNRNKLTKTRYEGVCLTSFESDTLMQFDVALVKVDTIRTPEIRIKSDRIKNDSVYVPIVGGIGKIEFSDDFKHHDLEFTTYMDCKIGDKDTAIVTKFKRTRK